MSSSASHPGRHIFHKSPRGSKMQIDFPCIRVKFKGERGFCLSLSCASSAWVAAVPCSLPRNSWKSLAFSFANAASVSCCKSHKCMQLQFPHRPLPGRRFSQYNSNGLHLPFHGCLKGLKEQHTAAAALHDHLSVITGCDRLKRCWQQQTSIA